MNAMILKILLSIFVLISISGCTTKTEYVDRIVRSTTVVPCNIPIPPSCEYEVKETYTEEIKQMYLCIKDAKSVIGVCNNKGRANTSSEER